jgi:ParB family transcriptional regulator, chromosome partitioning protein
MAIATQKIALSASRDIPFNRLVLSQSNVRRLRTGVSIEDLADDIARRTLLQSLSVRPVIDSEGKETGMFEVPAGGRRFRALELLVKQKRMTKTQLVPCVIRTGGLAEEDSLAENSCRQSLHPLDQYRAFQTLRDKGLSEEDIAARFFVAPAVVKQRLRLAAVSPKLLDVYAEDAMTLEQLMAFTVSSDHARQEKVWDSLARGYNREPYTIRRLLTESAVRAGDKRAQFVSIGAFEAAGGVVMRDLFAGDNGGWLQDPALLDRLTLEKLTTEATTLRAEGWKWIETAVDFPYGHASGLRRLKGEPVEPTAEEEATRAALQEEYDAIEAEHAGPEDLPDGVDARLGEIEIALAGLQNRSMRYETAEIAISGVFVSIDGEGRVEIERGFVRREDEISLAISGETDGEEGPRSPMAAGANNQVLGAIDAGGGSGVDAVSENADDEEGLRPLSDRLVVELTAHRTLALRDAMAQQFDAAFLSVLHVLALSAFYYAPSASCLEISVKSMSFGVQAPGLKDSTSAKAIEARQESWRKHLPAEADDLWGALLEFDRDSREALFAHCASLGLNAVHEQWNRGKSRQIHADRLARAVDLDMNAAGWRATSENYLGRVSKIRILEAVREGKGEKSAQLIGHLKKADMANEAERLLEGSGWLPEPLRTGDDVQGERSRAEPSAEALPAFLDGDDEQDQAIGEEDDSEPRPAHLLAAE